MSAARAPPRRPAPGPGAVARDDGSTLVILATADVRCRRTHRRDPRTHRLTLPPAPLPFASEATSCTMSPPTRQETPHLGAGSRYRPTPAADGRDDRPPPATAPPAQEHQWPPTPDPGHRPHAQPASPTAPLELANSTSALATLPEVLCAREAAAILRVGRNQLYQAVARGELGAVRIGRSIRIPRKALLDLLASVSSPPASGDE
jgi:excisionase family DNA binding protein